MWAFLFELKGVAVPRMEQGIRQKSSSSFFRASIRLFRKRRKGIKAFASSYRSELSGGVDPLSGGQQSVYNRSWIYCKGKKTKKSFFFCLLQSA
jgi:hypothetical protein